MNTRTQRATGAALMLAAALAAPALGQGARRAQSPQKPPAQDDPQGEIKTMRVDPGSDSTSSPAAPSDGFVGSVAGLQVYTDGANRFRFTVPQGWGRLAGQTADEVTFQSPGGDNMRVSVAPLRVTPQAFTGAYVDTYLEVLAQTFTDARFISQRTVTLSGYEATDYIFTAQYRSSPVLCHQVVFMNGKDVLYVTFAAFGSNRDVAEQVFLTSLLSFWMNPTFAGDGGATATAAAAVAAAPSYSLPVPDGWAEQPEVAPGSRTFRPLNFRPSSALLNVFEYKAAAGDPPAIDNAFILGYTARLKSMFEPGKSQIQQTSSTTLGGVQAVRYDMTYVTGDGALRRVALVLCINKGYVVGVSGDAAEAGYSIYEKTFDGIFAGFKFDGE